MKRALWALAFCIGSHSPAVAASTGHGALALAAIVGDDSPLLSLRTKIELARLLDDKKLGYGPHPTITVKADVVNCQAGDVDLAGFSCTLTFGKHNVTRTGRRANEIFATLIEAGVQSDGAAGHIFEAVHKLACKLEPSVIKDNNGGGVTCNYELGPQ